MQTETGRSKKRFTVQPPVAVLVVFLFSLALAALILSFSLFSWDKVWWLIVRSHFLILLLNWLPIFLMMLLFYYLTSNVMFSISSIGFIVLAMAFTNRLKLQLRGDPLFHWDLSLITEVLAVLKGFGLLPILYGLVAIFIYLLVSVCLLRIFRSARLSPKARGIGALACIVVILACNFTLYSSKELEKSLPTWGSFYNQADVHNSKGNLYSFLHTLNNSGVSKPDGYSAQETKRFIETYSEAHSEGVRTETYPSLIIIMGEAFSALSESDAFDFTAYRDPLQHFKRLGEEGILGSVVVPSRGGGTSDTEFDVLTARSARFLRGMPYAYRTITTATEAIPSLLAGLGYETLALHPGYSWFYNRQNVYRDLGFDKAVFEDAFAREAYLDTYISEEATFDMLLDLLREHEEDSPDTPLFTFCLTIQNHAHYHNRFVPENTKTFDSDAMLSDDEWNNLTNYFAGIADADDQLYRLATYLDSLDKPYVLVYYGDHLPALDEHIYNMLIPGADAAEGSLAYETRLYTTPFLIWPNAAARADGTFAAQAEKSVLPENRTISSNYLGAYALELLGYEGLSPYFDYVNETRGIFPVVMENFSYMLDGQDVSFADESALDQLSRLKNWMYHRLQEQ